MIIQKVDIYRAHIFTANGHISSNIVLDLVMLVQNVEYLVIAGGGAGGTGYYGGGGGAGGVLKSLPSPEEVQHFQYHPHLGLTQFMLVRVVNHSYHYSARAFLDKILILDHSYLHKYKYQMVEVVVEETSGTNQDPPVVLVDIMVVVVDKVVDPGGALHMPIKVLPGGNNTGNGGGAGLTRIGNDGGDCNKPEMVRQVVAVLGMAGPPTYTIPNMAPGGAGGKQW